MHSILFFEALVKMYIYYNYEYFYWFPLSIFSLFIFSFAQRLFPLRQPLVKIAEKRLKAPCFAKTELLFSWFDIIIYNIKGKLPFQALPCTIRAGRSLSSCAVLHFFARCVPGSRRPVFSSAIQKGSVELKRTLAIFISLCMAFTGLSPAVAFAQESGGLSINMPPADVTVTESDTRPASESTSDGFLDDNFLDDDFFNGGFSDTAESTSQSGPESTSESVPESSSQSSSESVPVSESTSQSTSESTPKPEAQSVSSSESSSETQEPEEEPEIPTDAEHGAVRVVISSALALKKDTLFQVYVNGPTKYHTTVTLPATGGSEIPTVTAYAPQLVPGHYTLVVVADGFARYTQEFTVDTLLYEVQLFTGVLGGYNYTSGSKHPGLLLIGDVNGDGAVDSADVQTQVNQLESGSQTASGDLNGDGVVDLADLQYLSIGYQNTLDTQAYLSTFVPSSSATASTGSDTRVSSGSIESLTSDKASEGVVLKTATGSNISEATPITLDFNFETSAKMEGLLLDAPVGVDNAITQASIFVNYEKEDGTVEVMEIPYRNGGIDLFAAFRSGGKVTAQPDGTLSISFGGQIAVKKVTFVIQGTQKPTNLAEISKVEFLNDMESRIPQPEMNIPEGVSAQAGNKSFTVTWKPSVNVTGYEVSVSVNGQEETFRTALTSLTVTTFGGKKLVNNTEYTVRVQSLNGTWKSGYSDPVAVTPKPEGKPPAPDNLTLTGLFGRIDAKWKNMEDTDTYTVYYRQKGTETYTPISGLTTNSCTIPDLLSNTVYEVYVTGTNDFGEGPASAVNEASTANATPAQLPAFQLINFATGTGALSAHITSAAHAAGTMENSPLDSGDSALGVFDNDYASYYRLNDWDDGATYPDNGGIRVTLDDTYNIGMISLAQPEDSGYYGRVRVYAKDESGKEQQVSNVTIGQRTDENGRKYYLIKIPGGISTQELRVCVGHPYWMPSVTIAEMRLHTYDSLEDDIFALYADDLHITLNGNVNEETINALQTRLDTPDAGGAYHPDRALLQKELDNARGLLSQTSLGGSIVINNAMVPSRDNGLGITGLNAWQPLGVSAAAGEIVVLYVGSEGSATGDSTPLELVATQQYAEHNTVSKVVGSLKIGRNELTIPQLQTIAAEQGGALYVQYASNAKYDASKQYVVRVDGGTVFPVLNVRGMTDETQRNEAITAYVQQLEAYVSSLQASHESEHAGSSFTSVSSHEYDEKTCILNTTDIVMDHMMFSVPASQILKGLSGDSTQKAQQLASSINAMEQAMELFYQHKGLTTLSGAGDKNDTPWQQLNIRYQRMFAGAFMYAAGNHIGIEWDSVPGLAAGQPVVLDEAGKYVSGDLFGWGIAHEIGHEINQSAYAVAEVTNNYFAQLATYANGATRFGYDAVYDKVTSGTTGPSSDVFTQLALYWQLHLAYDKDYEYVMYDDYQTLLDSRFFARVDTYARDTSKAPGSVALKLTNDTDQNLMRLSSAAAEKNLTDFFTRWGMTPNAETKTYMEQFPAETRTLYYINDAARDYIFAHSAEESTLTVSGKDVLSDATSASIGAQPNQVVFQFALESGVDASTIAGYEITRVTYENGQPQRQVVGYTTQTTFTDTVSSMNNRTIVYEVAAVDQFMNRSNVKALPALKIAHDGAYGKDNWTLETNLVSEQDTTPPADHEDPCAPETVSAIYTIADNDASTTYTGTTDEKDAVITVDFHETLEVTAMKYTVSGGVGSVSCTVQVSTNGTDWKDIYTGTLPEGDETAVVYFPNEDGDWVKTYDASQLRLTIHNPAGGTVMLSELDILGPTGDNVELNVQGIGVLKNDYVYEAETGEKIPAGSIVLTGTYKGNPAYNVVMPFDMEGNVVSAKDSEGNYHASQIILADVPEHGELGETSDGTWVYWIEPGNDFTMPEQIRVELYRVDSADTNAGQRLVSDTLPVSVPAELPSITLEP